MAVTLLAAWLARRAWIPPLPRAPSVIFVVLDDVRADHTSLCGYGRPTTPTLERLAREGASFTCDARAPGSWTLPSHASFFTGEPVTVHRAHETGAGERAGATTILAKGLDGALPTLAEQMEGFQTVAVSANPVVSKRTGLLRGFGIAKAAAKFGAWFGPRLLDHLGDALAELDPVGGPLFLFVNVLDAHNPWRSVPAGLGWAPRTEGTGVDRMKREGKWQRFLGGTMPTEERAALVTRVTDLYDYAIWRADNNLAGVLAAVEARGWCAAGCRVVVVSDHGEFLGEKGLLDHGHYVWEPDARVPLLVAEIGTDAEPPPLPSPVNALHAFHLVRDGELPDTLAPVASAAWPHVKRCADLEGAAFCATSAAWWEGATKWVWSDGVVTAYDLATDPGEDHPIEAPPPPNFDAFVKDVVAQSGAEDTLDPKVKEALEAAGYLE
ncbi:MAG: sulfatase-like hydrolase/transferase [Myxococcota bacterium]